MHRYKLGHWGSSCALALILASGNAFADARTDARRSFRHGMDLVAEGKYDTGVAELKKAYEMLPHINVLFNIARAYTEMGDVENALVYYERYALENPPDREDVLATMRQLQGRMDRQKATVAEAQKVALPKVYGPTPGSAITPGELAGERPGFRDEDGDGVDDREQPKPPKSGIATPGSSTAAVVSPSAVPKTSARTEGVYEEAVVTASRGAAQSPLDAANSIAVITGQDIHLSGITKIPELLRRVAGVDIMQVSASQNEISMRGFNQRLSNKVLVLVDGRSVFVDFFGGVLWELLSIDVDQVDRIEIVRGPGSALYGADAFAGVVNIITKAPGTGEDKLRVGGGPAGSSYGSFRVAGRDEDLAYRASVGYTRNAAWGRTSPANRVDTVTLNRDPDLAGENKRFDLRLTHPIGRDYVVGIGGGVVDAFSDFYAVGALKEYQLDAKSGDITAYLQGRHFSYRAFYNFIRGRYGQAQNYVGNSLDATSFTANVVDNELAYTQNFTTGSFRHAVNLGANYRLRNAATAYTGGDRTEHHMGVFAQESATYKKWLNLVASARADYVPYTQKVELSPRLSALVHPTERSTVRAGFSTAFRKPTFLEGYVDLGVQAPLGSVQTNTASMALVDEGVTKRLNVEKILTAEVGYTNQESDIFDVEASVYFNRITDLIQLAPLSLLGPADSRVGFDQVTGRYVVGLSGFVNQCAAFNVVGGELGLRTYPVPGLDVFANYAYNHVAIDRPEGCEQPADSRTSAHKVNAGVQWRTKPGIDGEVTFHWVSDQVWSERDVDQKQATLVFKELPLGAYKLVNARIGWKIHPEVGEISATVFNALDDAHREHPFTNQLRRRVTLFYTRDL